MARYLLTQYNTKTVNHPRDRKGDKNRKKSDESISEDKDNNNTGTVCAHVEEVTTPQDPTAPSNVSSTGAYVSEVAKPEFRPARFVEELLAAHPIDDAILSRTDASDVSIDTVNSAEVLAGSHIKGKLTYTFCRSDPHDDIHNDDVSWYNGSVFWTIMTMGRIVKESIKSDFFIGGRQS